VQKIKLRAPIEEHKGTTDSCCTGPKTAMTASACCPPSVKEKQQWATGMITTSTGTMLKISTVWNQRDYWGMIKSRVSSFRLHYTVPPGPYAVGEPKKNSDVFITANYKMSFDVLRRSWKT